MSTLYSLWRVGHGQTDEVAAGQREENHDDRKCCVVFKQNRKVVAALDITEHQQRDEHDSGDHQHREETGLFRGLQRRDVGEYMKT